MVRQSDSFTSGRWNWYTERGTFAPPLFKLVPGVSGVFGAYPLRFVLVEAYAVIDPHGSGCAGFRIPLFVGAVVNAMHIVIGTGELT